MKSYNRLCHLNRLTQMLIVIVMLVFGWKCWFLFLESQMLYLQATLETSASGQMQLYYDRGDGFNEHDSVVVNINKEEGNVGNEKNVKYRFNVRPLTIKAIRFDHSLNDTGRTLIKSMNFVDGLGNLLTGVNLSQDNSTHEDDSLILIDREVMSLSFDPPISIKPKRLVVLNSKFVVRILLNLCFAGIVVFLGFLFKRFIPINLLESLKKNCLFVTNPLLFNGVIFVSLTVLFLCLYYPVSTQFIPVLFHKVLLCTLIITIVRYVFYARRKIARLQHIMFCMAFYLLWIAISVLMHYYAENLVGRINHISIIDLVNPNMINGHGTVFDKFYGMSLLTNFNSLFIYYFPFLLFTAIALFGTDNEEWSKLIWIPVIFVPSLIIVFYQHYIDVSFLNNWPTDNFVHGLGTSFVSLRITLFLVFPLCVLAGVIERNRWKKIGFLLIALAVFWMTRCTTGRAAILGTLIFVGTMPIIRLWVNDVPKITWYKYLSGAFIILLGCIAFTWSISQKNLEVIGSVVSHDTVQTTQALMHGDFSDSAMAPRVEMTKQSMRLSKLALVSGWGPAGFQKNSARIRYINGDKPGIPHHINLYLQMCNNFGVMGVGVLLLLQVIPLWMIFCVRKKIRGREERWAVGIVFTTVVIMMLLFLTNPNIDFPEPIWLYVLYLGFLVATAIKYKYTPTARYRYWLLCGGVLTSFFIVGTYKTTFGEYNYQSIPGDLISKVTHGYYPKQPIMLWDSKKDTDSITSSNRLIHTKSSPYRMKYSTNVFSMHAISDLLILQPDSNLFCLKISVLQPGQKERFFLTVKMLLDNKIINKHVFHMKGEKLLFCYLLPDQKKNGVEIKLDLDMWWSMPYHGDARDSLNQKYMPSNRDYRDFGVRISLVPYGQIGK